MNSEYKKRQILCILSELDLVPWLVVVLMGGVGATVRGPFYGFALFGWVTVLIFVFLILFFYIFIIG